VDLVRARLTEVHQVNHHAASSDAARRDGRLIP
jgi:hypothetical protein